MRKRFSQWMLVFLLAVASFLIYNEYSFVKTGSNSPVGTEFLLAEAAQQSSSEKKLRLGGGETSIPRDDPRYERLFNDVLMRIKGGYVEEVSDKQLIESAINGMLSSLDPHSSYMSKEDFNEMQIQTKGEFGGLGIEITMEDSLVKVISPIDDTPAFKAGIRSGDYISKIDGKSVIGMTLTEAVKLMRGKVGTTVNITVLREGESDPLEFKIKRGAIKMSSVRGSREGDIMYLRISNFNEQTYSGLVKEFNKLEGEIGKNNLKGLVLDLRGNPGGLLDQSIMVSELFLGKNKTIVEVRGRNGEVFNTYISRSDEKLIPDIPMVVLINEGSASASEIVAGALQDNNRAIIMGTKSFGKGSVQSVIPLEMGGAIKMTIARYYTPSGRSIQADGVQPNIEVQLAKVEMIDLSKYVQKEEDLSGHLEGEEERQSKIKKASSTDSSMAKRDYQLSRALDLLMGLDFYRENEGR